MGIDDHNEADVSQSESINGFVRSIKDQERELVLTSEQTIVGAILTAEQYEWFLDQLDACQDVSFINDRYDDKDGSQSLDDFKKDLEE